MGRTKYIPPREAAMRLGLRLDSVYALLWAGKLKGQKREGRWHVAVRAVEERLQARRSSAR